MDAVQKAMNKIKSIRTTYNLSTRGLAAQLGVSHRTVEGWEQGRPMRPSMQILLDITVALLENPVKSKMPKNRP